MRIESLNLCLRRRDFFLSRAGAQLVQLLLFLLMLHLGDRDLFDFGALANCIAMGGPTADIPPGCELADFDSNAHIDLLDFRVLQDNLAPSTGIESTSPANADKEKKFVDNYKLWKAGLDYLTNEQNQHEEDRETEEEEAGTSTSSAPSGGRTPPEFKMPQTGPPK